MRPGDYPDRLLAAAREMQIRSKRFRFGNRRGLFDVRSSHDVSVLLGCGVGGTSLINASVALEPDSGVFDDRWPKVLRGARDPDFVTGLEAARSTLGSNVTPTQLRGAKFAGIVLDYDGTLVDTRHRFEAAREDYVSQR